MMCKHDFRRSERLVASLWALKKNVFKMMEVSFQFMQNMLLICK